MKKEASLISRIIGKLHREKPHREKLHREKPRQGKVRRVLAWIEKGQRGKSLCRD